MDALQPDQHQRQSVRCPSVGVPRVAELQIGTRRVPICVVDESAGGLGVVVAQPPGVEKGAVILATLDSVIHKVRVAFIREVAAADSSEPSPLFRMGLERLDEVAVLQDDNPHRVGWLRRLLMRGTERNRSSGFVTGLLLVLAAAGIPLLVTVPLVYSKRHTWRLAPLPPRESSKGSEPAVAASPRPGPTSSSDAGDWQGVTVQTQNASNVSGRTETGDRGPSDRGLTPLAPSPAAARLAGLVRLPGASGLLAADMIRDLGLTDDQLRKIRSIVESTTQQIRELDADSGSRSRQDQSQQEDRLLDESRARAIDALTAEQRQRLQSHLAEPR